MKRVALLTAMLLLAGCGGGLNLGGPSSARAPGPDTTRPVYRPAEGAAPPPPANATTAEAFDTTTEEQRAAATEGAEAPAAEALLGTTIATLGNPAEAGFWLETPLVDTVTPGRVEAANGESVLVELRPIDGPADGGSRISLPALRLLNVGLTGLHELKVYRR